MRLLNKLVNRTDFSNPYTINRVLSILDNEFSLALKYNNSSYAAEIMETARQIEEMFKAALDEVNGKQVENKVREFLSVSLGKVKTKASELQSGNL